MADLLLDTTVLVDLARGYLPAIRWFKSAKANRVLGVSVLSWFEMLAGSRNLREQTRTDKMMEHLEVFQIAEADSELALDWYRQHHLSDGVGFIDCLIGAVAARLALPLLTSNTRHFALLPGVQASKPY